MLNHKLKRVAGNTAAPLYVEDVFSTYLYTGNGSTQTITNGIDLAGEGGLVWVKDRSPGYSDGHALGDTERGTSTILRTNDTQAAFTPIGGSVFTSFRGDGFSLGNTQGRYNISGSPYVSWTFRKAPKFFDVVTYTGDGAGGGRTIAHSLDIAPGLIIVKNTSSGGTRWAVYHRSLGAGKNLWLDGTDAALTNNGQFPSDPTSTVFTLGSNINGLGATYVAYLWAHDPSEEGIIQCGSYVGNNTTGVEVTLGWEPQFVLVKSAVSASGHWALMDNMRGASVNNARGNTAILVANGSFTESSFSNDAGFIPTSTGFRLWSGHGLPCNGNSQTHVYLAIRRPNKPPTSGAEVFGTNTRSGTSANTKQTTVYPVDMVFQHARNNTGACDWWDRLRGGASRLRSDTTDVESVNIPNGIKLDYSDGFATSTIFSNTSSVTYADWLFKRAPGFFDVVCYTGTGVARTVPHGLGVAPELMIVKRRNGSGDWAVYNKSTGIDKYLNLNSNQIPSFDPVSGGRWDYTLPTNAVFALNTNGDVNASGSKYITYLFASLPGISKVGSYTGNGASQTIDCGFSTGARFVLIKRTDSAGDWYIWDSARGIVAGNDPHLSLNTRAAEVTTDDSVDPDASGFIVNQVAATNINVNSASYIFLTIA